MKVCCIGIGVMGGALMKAVIKVVGKTNLLISDGDLEKSKVFAKENGCVVAASNVEAVKESDIVFIAVKPAFVGEVLDEIGPYLDGKIVVSVAAGLTIASIKEMYSFSIMMAGEAESNVSFIRIMPNIPAIAGQAMIAICADPSEPEALTEKNVAIVSKLLSHAGQVDQVNEKMMDAVTAISGSGPAYAFMFIEALADAAVRMGMSRRQAYIYASQTLKGAAEMQLLTGSQPGELKDAVCSPAGTTIEAVKVLEDRGFRSAIMNAAEAAYEKAQELGRKK
ncbi:MAG: pyrroline-5-carboxylate reductase [Spirochaetaceae bacterium]|nr:pyrroline-5-carboxylate reductase [Spirochaetaceae bacterium]